MIAVTVREHSQVAEARRVAVKLARKQGFGEEDAGRVAIVATELATNMIKHGGGGELLVSSYDDRTGAGVECLALDKGSGIRDLDASLRDGHSTAGTLGTGLGAVVRGSHLVDIFAPTGGGAAVLARLQSGRPLHAQGALLPAVLGAVNLPMTGEEACGDAWCRRAHGRGFTLMVADGLGHGPLAAAASHAAIEVFLAHPQSAPLELLERMHEALRSTRGAAVAIADVDLDRSVVTYVGVGNIAGSLLSGGETKGMVSHNGTVGRALNRVQAFTYSFDGAPMVVMASDGLGTRWSLDAYPGLGVRHPALIAGVLYRDFNRGRDDVTVLVATGEAG